jgi:hypothetical protein
MKDWTDLAITNNPDERKYCSVCDSTGVILISCCGIDMDEIQNDLCPECKEHCGIGIEEPCGECEPSI